MVDISRFALGRMVVELGLRWASLGGRIGQNECMAWHADPVAVVVETLGSDLEKGLDDTEASRRIVRDGPNELDTGPRRGPLSILMGQFRDVLVWVLIVAAAVSAFIVDEYVDAIVIAAIVVLNAAIGFTQEMRAESALDELASLSAPRADVVRGGQAKSVPSREVVPGDIVLLETGDLVPADCRLAEAVRLRIDESSLTGESQPVSKQDEPVAESALLADRRSMVFSSTTVSAGRATAVVVETGTGTELGKIAEMLRVDEPPTPLAVELDRTGRRIGGLTLVIAVAVFAIGLVRNYPPEAMFLSAVALAVAAIPEGLTAVVTVILARGVQEMSKRNAIVRRLRAVETLGAATVICTDKTGTLTQNRMRVQFLELASMSGAMGALPTEDHRVVTFGRIAALCNDARHEGAGFVGDSTEVALLEAIDPVLVNVEALRTKWERVDEVPFDSTRKRMTTIHESEGRWFVAHKGAPERVVERCSSFAGPDGVEALTDERRSDALASANDMATRGLRTLAFAYREGSGTPLPTNPEEGLVLVAVVGIADAIRPEAPDAVAKARDAGVDVVMVTGDHVATAQAIANDLGLIEGRAIAQGSDMANVDAAEIPKVGVFARVEPADKVTIVHAWQQAGAVVAMTGDGVNDAPALRAADVGVSMGTGTDVARQASTIVLADDNFSSIVAAIEQGRVIYDNLRKVIYFLLSANLAEVLVMVVGFLAFGGIGEPLLATQLLYVNLITDGLPALGLGMDPPSADVMKRSPNREGILTPSAMGTLAWQAAILGVAVLGAFVVGHWMLGLEWEATRTMALTTLVLTQMAHVFNIRAGAKSVWTDGFQPNRTLLVGIAASIIVHVVVVMSSLGQSVFGTVALSLEQWGITAILAAVSALIVNAIKVWRLRNQRVS